MEGGDSSDVPPAHRAGEAEVEGPRKDDSVLLLADESFDFDLSLSSLSANEDDEVFFGPVGHRERCIAARLKGDTPSPEAGRVRWSPLTGEKFVEVYKEAHLLAFQIESSSRSQAAHAARPEGGERFIQDSRLKISLFEKENESRKSPGSLKRETYCLLEGPLSGPQLSGVQPASGVGPRSTAAQAQLTRTWGPSPPPRPSLPLDPSPVRPPSQAATQKRVVSRLPPPRASVRGKNTHLAVEKSVKETPASPSGAKTLAEKESQGDRPPDTPSAAQDVTGAPARGGPGGPGKRALPVPSKVGLKRTALKPPGCAAGLARKPGAPGGFSGGSSRACPSPVGSTGASGGRRSVSAEGSRPPSDPRQPGPGGAAAAPPSLQARPAAVCGQSWCPGRPAAPTTSAPPQPQTPEEPRGARLSSQTRLPGSARRSAAGGARRESSLHSGTKAVPAPASPFKVPKFPAGGPPDSATPRLSRAPRPQSCTSTGRAVHGTPARRASGPVSRTPVSAPRVAALLTPAGRRLSGLPVPTPRTQPRTLAAPQRGSARRLSSEPRRRPVPGSRCWDEPSDGSSSPPAAVPQALSFSPEKSDFALPTSVAAVQAPDEAQAPADMAPAEVLLVDIPLERLRIAPAAQSSPPADVALIDFRSPPGAGGPLIDLLVNTPDAGRSAAAKLPPHVGQLVDPCAPLIQLSPEADKENMDSPLLKF
ncbi:G2 and S phase-expressed protein 1 isoform X2 [Phyllostomus hastatus]|nr:G2 and S phase-expressed protein 1 isoform X2 [Phyllostomus hastatus]XP_045690888.1 G2 and S phase-expressed protein 1 isoform X2 [Phyllostomus hastatus]